MRLTINNSITDSTNLQKIFSFLVDYPSREFFGPEIQKIVRISKAGVYRALKELVRQKFVVKNKKGKFYFYSILPQNCVVKQFKALKNVIFLKPLVDRLKNSSRKIVLFGSSGRGEDRLESDIDILVISKEPSLTRDMITQSESKRKIQAVIKTAVEFSELEKKNPTFLREINSGIVLWEEGYE